MVTIIAESEIRQDALFEYMRLVKELIAASRREQGCIAYNLYRSLSNPLKFTLIENWENEQAIESHNNSEHFRRIIPLISALRTDSHVERYEETGI
jgi:quinol monooxygenase YgiN